MRVIFNPDHTEHNPPYEHYDGVREAYAEVPERAEAIITRLRQDPLYTIQQPKHYPPSHIQNVHHAAYIQFLRMRCAKLGQGEVLYPSYFMSDTYAPVVPATFQAAIRAVDTALAAADHVLAGNRVAYALCRPPGHHAGHTAMGGYCYFNNAAVAANHLAEHGRVAILDIDYHHGNGTQAAFYDRNDVLYVSLHATPEGAYPYVSGFTNEQGRGEGQGFTKNYPLPLGTADAAYLHTLRTAIQDVQDFAPDYLVVSAGFDAYINDPRGELALTLPCYAQIGQAVQALNLPTLIVQEGGYNVADLGELAHAFLQPFRN